MRPGYPTFVASSCMTTSQVTSQATAPIDPVQRLSDGFHDTFRTFVARDEVFTPDAFFDLNMPVWRFQLQGRDAFAAQLRHLAEGAVVHVDVLRTVATVSGFVTEHVERADGGWRGAVRAPDVALHRAGRAHRRGRRLLQRRVGRGACGPGTPPRPR